MIHVFVCECVQVHTGVLGGRKRAVVGSLELELRTVVSFLGAMNLTPVYCHRNNPSQALIHLSSPVMYFFFNSFCLEILEKHIQKTLKFTRRAVLAVSVNVLKYRGHD